LALTVGVPTLTLLFGVAVVLYLPADYFVRGTGDVTSPRRHEVVRVTVRISRTLLGGHVASRIFMALPLVPGPAWSAS